MEILLTSLSLVTLAEFGDKTQLLALFLVARYREPFTILVGITLATTLNHLLAALAGQWMGVYVDSILFRAVLSLTFIIIGVWMLIPDSLDTQKKQKKYEMGAFLSTLVCFFLAEIGDKTQVATVALAAKYHDVWMVMAGTTAGMIIANLPVLVLGDKLFAKVPVKTIRYLAAGAFGIMGIVMIMTA